MTIYKTFKKILEEQAKRIENEIEKNDNDVRKILAGKDNTYTFKANFDAVEDINWDMFKNE